MTSSLRQIASRYVSSRWIPATVALIIFGAYVLASIPRWKPAEYLADALFILFVVSFLGILVAAVRNLVKRRWWLVAIHLISLIVVGVVTLLVIVFWGFFGPSTDGFADHLIIPTDIEVALPQPKLSPELGGDSDTFQTSLVAALKRPGTDDPTVSATINPLIQLRASAPDVFERYLATSPAWRVFEEHGERFATRRWMIGSHWSYSLHGYYTDPPAINVDTERQFQSRLTLGLSGKPWFRGNEKSSRMKAGETRAFTLSEGNQMRESHGIIEADGLVVEIFEQSQARERRLTKAALAFLYNEFSALLADPTWTTVRNLLPPGSIRRGKPALELRGTSGNYDAEIWINPGEPGMIYLKAFEVTEGTKLSDDRLKAASNEWVGWSADRDELFFSNTTFTIYEGDWGKPYAARFEVWFVPNSGAPERKLIEKVFKIDGWQR